MMDRYSSEFPISPKHVVFLSYLHFNVSANALVLNNKTFFLFLVLGSLAQGRLCWLAAKSLNQCGPLDIEIISEEFIVMLRQLSYAIKNQLKAPKAY